MIGSRRYVAFFVVATGVLSLATPLAFVSGHRQLGILAVGLLIVVTLGFTVSAVRMAAQQLSGKLPKKFVDAKVALATLESVEQTGTTINENPVLLLRLQVATETRETFASTARQLVGLHEMHLMNPGMQLLVRYRDEDRREVAVDPNPDQETFDRLRVLHGLVSERLVDIARRGTQTQAVVVGMRPTGQLRGGDPEIELDLAFTTDALERREVTVTRFIASRLVHLVQTGAAVDVRYLSSEPDEVVLALPNA